MKIIKNPIYHASGVIDCELELNGLFVPHTLEDGEEYEIHEDSEWSQVAQVDQSIRDDYESKKTRDEFKQSRTEYVSNITVTTAAGNEFDGDETSQTRMARALVAMDEGDLIPWVLVSNEVISATKAELKEALKLSGEAQSAAWVQQ